MTDGKLPRRTRGRSRLRESLVRAAPSALALSLAACGSVFEYPNAEPERDASECSDKVDNDFDGKTDCDDTDCNGSCPEETAAECSDQRDNDGDGLTDGADPRCWLLAAPEVQRCAEARGVDIVDTFDVGWPMGYLGSAWAYSAHPFPDFRRGHQGGREDLVLAFSNPDVEDLTSSWAIRQWAFSGSWQGLDLSFSASVPHGTIVRVALVPVRLVPAIGNPRRGAEGSLFSIVIDTTRTTPTFELDVEGARYPTASSEIESDASAEALSEDFSDVRVVLEKDGFHATLTRANGKLFAVQAPAPSSLSLPPVRLVVWGGTGDHRPTEGRDVEVAIDDLRLHVAPERPCGFRAPQIPGPSCEYESRFKAFGHQISVARGSDGQQCALVTAGQDAFVGAPESLTAWTSANGETWSPASSIPAPPVGLPPDQPLVGAGIAHDGEAFHVAVATQEASGVRLGLAAGTSCGQFGPLAPGPLLPMGAEAPSYVIAGAQHAVYFTLPAGERSRQTLWRVKRNGESTSPSGWLDPERLTELPAGVGSASVQRIGARDVLLTYATAPGAKNQGVGVLVGDAEGRDWQNVDLFSLPDDVPNAWEGHLAFDDFAARSAALSFAGDSGFVLYGAYSGSGWGNGYEQYLSVGSARLAPAGMPFPEAAAATPSACGNGTCDVGEACVSCAADCSCGGSLLLSDAFADDRRWGIVSNDPHPAAVRTLDRRHHALNWSGQSISDQLLLANPSTEAPAPVSNPTTWSVLPLERSIVGDFELSFDLLFNWIDPPGFPSMPACTLYVGLGTVPVLATESAPDGPGSAPSQSGVFAAMPWSGCVGKYLARPSVHARGAVYEDRNETFGDPYACLLERHLSSSKTRRMTLRREGNKVTVSVPRDDGCGIAERTITYSGAVPDLPALLVGSGGGDFAPCTLSHIDKTTVTFTNGSGTLSNVELRLLDDPGQCPGTEALCGKGSQEPACVDTKTSSEHCGACGHACGANEICTEGRCGEKPPPNITWLTFDDQGRARSDELGIDGVLYAAADPCVTATLEWDPRTRCTTGKLCEFGTDHRNFGLGLDFDFLRRGDTTLTFNPEEAGVRGIAWEISGHAPGLQVWMLNMDPKWNGECSGDWTAPVIPFCRMPGAPDGMPIAPLVGQLFFDAMVKDNWFTNGVRYTYDPRAVYGFEINLPTDTAPPKASFSFCVDRIGVIR